MAFLGKCPPLLTRFRPRKVVQVKKTARFGAYDPVFTPFGNDGSLNLDAVAPYARFTAAAGTDTIILGGSTGEWPSMTSDERLDVLWAWRSTFLSPRWGMSRNDGR